MKEKHYTLLTIVFAHLFIDFMLGIFPIYKTMANLDVSMAGIIMGLALIVGESAQLIIGYFSDRGLQKALMIGGVLLGSGLALLSSTQDPFLLFLVVLSGYLGSAAFHPSASSLTGGLCDKRQGFYLALFSAGGMVGAAASQILFVQLMHLFYGNTFILALPPIFVSLAILLHIPVSQRSSVEKHSLKKQLAGLWDRRGDLAPLYGMQVSAQIILASIMFLLPDLLLEKGLPKGFCFGGAHLSLLIGGALFNLAIAKFNDRWNKTTLLAILMFTGMAVHYALIASGQSLVLAVTLTACLGASLTALQPIIVAEGNRSVPQESRGVVNGLLWGGASFPAGLGVMLTAKLSTAYSPALAMQAVGSLSLFFLLFNLSRSWSGNLALVKSV